MSPSLKFWDADTVSFPSRNRLTHGGKIIFACRVGNRLLGFFVRMLNKFLRQFFQERRWLAGQKLSVFFPPAAMRNCQRQHRARDGDVK